MKQKTLNCFTAYAIAVVVAWLIFDAYLMPLLPREIGEMLFSGGVFATLALATLALVWNDKRNK